MTTALLFRFPFPGPWGKELTEASRGLANDIATEDGLIWKIWLEDRETGQAGGIYLFQDAAAAARYREKHERRLSAMGPTGVMANAFSVNAELSVLTMARAALDDAGASKSTSAATAAFPS
jgi:Putative mono-oxygenase ydhR